jgi:hypothetical protein
MKDPLASSGLPSFLSPPVSFISFAKQKTAFSVSDSVQGSRGCSVQTDKVHKKKTFIFKWSKIAPLGIFIETVEVALFL